MLLPFPTDPALPSNPAPLFNDISAVRGDHMRANNAEIWANFAAVNLMIPIGTVIPLIQSYFGANNSSPVAVSVDLPDIWHECDGTAPADADSPIWNAAGRYLPDLTGDIFLMGDTAAGGVGGDNDATHNHDSGSIEIPPHNHKWYDYTGTSSNGMSYNFVGGLASIEAVSVTGWSGIRAEDGSGTNIKVIKTDRWTEKISLSLSGSTSNNTTGTENRPDYMAVKYIIRIK